MQLKKRLYAEGLKQRICEMCGQDELWHGRRLALILDHVNGVSDDHRLENLRILCRTAPPRSTPIVGATCAALASARHVAPSSGRQARSSGTAHIAAARSQASRDAHEQRRIVERPPYTQLLAEISATNWSAVGRRYGVSDNAVRKWVRAYEREGVADR